MKLFWHIGPHKTGTTSLELALKGHSEAGRARFYYPPVTQFGPGHAMLAWTLLGLNKNDKDPQAIRNELKKAAQLGFEKVVISSEEFSRAILTPTSFAPLREICSEIETELVITLRPLTARVNPEVQELIKNGSKLQFASPHDLLAVCNERPGLRADFLPAAIYGMRPAATTVIMTDAQHPAKLFEDISRVLDEPIPVPRNPKQNASYEYIRAAWLDVLNRHGRIPVQEARPAVDAAFAAAVKEVKALANVAYPPLPPALERYLSGVWDLEQAYLVALSEAGQARVL